MKNKPKVTVIVDNCTRKRELLAEHGLAFLIEYQGKNILFDTGQGMALLNNLKKLNFDINKLDAVIISHGHYDHTGALKEVCDANPNIPVFIHPKAFDKRYSLHKDGSLHNIGIQYDFGDNLNLKLIDKPTEIFNSFFLTGTIPLQNHFEDSGGNFFIDKQCKHRDLIPDDQAVFIETSKGITVILGCSHSGVINTLNYIKKLSKSRKICNVIGGMHLVNANDYRIDKTINELQKFNLKMLYPTHCTGFNASTKLYNHFKECCQPLVAGDSLEII